METQGRQTKLTEDDIQHMTYLRDVKKMSYPKIAKLFYVDHSTVQYHLKNYYLKKYGRSKQGRVEITKPVKVKKIDKYPVEKENLGKRSYAEYLQEQKDREFNKLIKKNGIRNTQNSNDTFNA